MQPRRSFLKKAIGASALLGGSFGFRQAPHIAPDRNDLLEQFQAIERAPIVRHQHIPNPVPISDIGVYRNGEHFFLRARSKSGVEGIAAMKPKYAERLYPIIYEMVAPILKGKDARKWDELLDDLYLKKLNYKWQGLALWVAIAYVEIAVLDMLGKAGGVPISTLLGSRVRDEVDIYYASGRRGNAPEAEMEHLLELVEASGAEAVKYRLGARMHYTDESMARDKALIPLVRKTLGSDATIYTDANGSFDVPTAIEIGRILEAHGTDFFEEPCPFDYYDETKAVADALNVPVAGGEEEASMRRFMWFLTEDALQVVQPDLLFFGGLVRSAKVAKMAEIVGKPCTPHISGDGLGFLYMMHFASFVPNIGPYQEFKGNEDGIPVESSVSLQPSKGRISVPKAPGLGITFDPAFLDKAERVKAL